MVFINFIEKHLQHVEIMDEIVKLILNKNKIDNKIDENHEDNHEKKFEEKLEELRESLEISNMKLNELKALIREHEYFISEIIAENKNIKYKLLYFVIGFFVYSIYSKF
jgi:hypothetical protein